MSEQNPDRCAFEFSTVVLEEPGNDQRAVITPVYRTSIYKLTDVSDPFGKGYVYSRYGNPNVNGLEEKLARLEQGQHGYCFASGMAAITTFLLSLLGQGDHIICEKIVYGGTHHFLTRNLPEDFGVETTFVDLTDPNNLRTALRDNTKLLYLESPTNPTLEIVDITELSRIAHEHGLYVVIDNTFASPYLQNPIAFGADGVIHSMTKYIGGHSNEIGGCIVLKDDGPTIKGKPLSQRVREYQRILGGVMSPDTAWQMNQSIKTLPLRMAAHCQNALAVAQFLNGHPAVSGVIYPGLPSHPQHELAKKQMPKGFGGMVTAELHGGRPAVLDFLNRLPHPFSAAVSLGGVESLAFPAQSLYPLERQEDLENRGVTGSMVRLSIGIEAIGDLTRVLDETLKPLVPA